MSPLIGYHATSRSFRRSITERGLLGAGRNDGRPFGVYVFNDDFAHPSRGRIYWSGGRGQDVWQVAYIGPMSPDIYVTNGMILHERVQPECLSLITLLTPNI